MVGAAGIEPATTCSQSRYATAALRPVVRDYRTREESLMLWPTLAAYCDWALLALRLVVAVVFFRSGLSHARDAASTAEVARHTRMAALEPELNRLKYWPLPSL